MEDNGLPKINRFVTDHDEKGAAIFSNSVPEPLPWHELPDGARFSLAYATNRIPVEMTNEADIDVYKNYMKNLPGIMIYGGTVLRIVDMRPGATSPMHRTLSLDYGVVLEGQIELVLDSGEVRVMNRGDVSVQRGTNHAWRNTSKTQWARMLYVLQEAAPIFVNGEPLEEDYGGMPGVKPSKY